ncbi:MAG: peptidase T [Clostridia bacterium]|nr:peptidase T [Clostridia bacterium]
MENVKERFLRYIRIDTQSCDGVDSFPSTEKQLDLARLLEKELLEMGASDVTLDENGYLFATIPATSNKKTPVVGFISHMDTAPAYSGKGVNPQFAENYDGSELVLDAQKGITMSPAMFPSLLHYVGKELIYTDGSTLLGADDKAGVAEIMTFAQYLLTHPEIEHGEIKIGFTPDEEVGRGADFFDVARFGADVAYTVDGGELGEIEYENFNAAAGLVTVHGASIHPGSAKGKMKNAILIGTEFESLLPAFDKPMYTEGYEGFFHLDRIEGDVENCRMEYIIRDHDAQKFDEKCKLFERAGAWLNEKYGEGTVDVTVTESYRNMREKVEPHMYLIDIAKKAMTNCGAEPKIVAIRGGTDGARLSYMGLPCPNLSTGGENFHGKYEFICTQSMETMVDVLTDIAKQFTEVKN